MGIITPEEARYEHMAKKPRVLTLESLKEEKAPGKVVGYTKKYGEVVSFLKPGFEKDVKIYEATYEVDVPDEVMTIAKEIYSLGGRALLEGGSVRDAVVSKEIPGMKLVPKDFDFEIYGITPEQLLLILEKVFGPEKIDPVGKAFGILKVQIPGWSDPLDFSIPRRDSKTGVGHKGFEIEGDPAMSIQAAALRRDLTMNCLAYDPLTKVLFDAYGGVEDIRARTIDVTDETFFQEDPLRVMRVMQFASRLNFQVTERTKALCKKMVGEGQMDELPRERIWEEVKKWFEKGIKPSAGLMFAKEIGFLQRYWPELESTIGVPQEPEWHPEGDVWIHTLQSVDAAAEIADREIKAGRLGKKDKLTVVLGTLCHDLGKPATTQVVDGRIRSLGHEPAGVGPTKTFLERIWGVPEARGVAEQTAQVLPLVAEHLRPVELWEYETEKGQDVSGAVRRLAQRLFVGDKSLYPDGKGSSGYLLGLVAEADQRGRNPYGSMPLGVNEVPNLAEWQRWWEEKITSLGVSKKPAERMVTGEQLLGVSGVKAGPGLGVALEAVYLDQMEGKIGSAKAALEAAESYYLELETGIKQQAGGDRKKEKEIWNRVKGLSDVREYRTLL